MIATNEIISFLLGAGVTILTTLLNNRYQLKRDKLKFENDLILEDKKNEFELDKISRVELLSDLERLNTIVGKLEHSISLTSSVIESEKELSHLDFDSKYQKELEHLIELESLTVSKFTEIYDTVCSLSGLHNQYWGNQRLLLLTDINTDRESYVSLQSRIIKISNKSKKEISKIRNLSLQFAKRTKNKYVT